MKKRINEYEHKYQGENLLKVLYSIHYDRDDFSELISSFAEYISISDRDYLYNQGYLLSHSKEYMCFIDLFEKRERLYTAVSNEILSSEIDCDMIVFDECIAYEVTNGSLNYTGLIDDMKYDLLNNNSVRSVRLKFENKKYPDFYKKVAIYKYADEEELAKYLFEEVSKAFMNFYTYFR